MRPSPKHYKCFKNKAKLIPIKEMLRCAKQHRSAGATAALIYPSLIEIDAKQGKDQRLESRALQAGNKGKIGRQLEDLDNCGGAAAEYRGSGSMQAKLNRLCMHEERPEIQQSPEIDKEAEQEVTAALAITSKVESAPTYEQFDQWVHDKENVCPEIIKQVLMRYRHLFIDKLPPGLPPERVIDHTITLVPGKLPKKGQCTSFLGTKWRP